jgi:hypothetical protein
MKSFSATANRDEYYRDHTISVDCVELHLKDNSGANQALYLCSGGFDVSFDSPTAPTAGTNTYSAQGNFIGFSGMSEDMEVKVGKFTITLSAIGNNFIPGLIEWEIESKRVCIYKAFLGFGAAGTDPLSLVATPILMYDGTIYNFSVNESAKTCQISIDCSSLFADFERSNGRKTNNWSNWLFQGANQDKAFDKAGWVGQTKILWGRAS